MEQVLNVAQYIMEKYKELSGKQIDEMKLHKLLYFAQRESFAIVGAPMFHGTFEGWKYGPVCREVRYNYDATGMICRSRSKVSESNAYILNNIILQYGRYASWVLSQLSHKETSWINSRKGIPDGENGHTPLSLQDIQQDATKVRPYDSVYDMYYDEFEDAEECH